MQAPARGWRFVVCYLLFSVLVFVGDTRGVFIHLHRLFQTFTVPAQSKLYETKRNLTAPFSWFFDRRQTFEEAEKLRGNNISLLARLEELKSVEEENENLRRLLGADIPPSWKFAPAKVVSVEGDRFILTGDYTPEVGMVVVGSPPDDEQPRVGVLLGLVTSVVGKKIEVVSPTSTTSRIPVVVSGLETQSAAGLLVGRGGRAVLDQVLTKETIGQDYAVATSGGDNFPAGLLVGRITKVLPIYQGAWQQAEVELAVEVETLDTVFFVTKF